MVINYDIHWNPVRVIQRVGRIDRIGSPNTHIQSINFWPAKDINEYINLRERVEKRMAMMKLAGSEVIEEFTDQFQEIAKDDSLEARQNENMLRQMENKIENLEEEESIGFADFSFDNYRQLLNEMLNQKRKEFQDMPNGVFSGFKIENSTTMQNGMIALLGYPAQKKFNPNHKYTSYELIYIDAEGNQISNNQKIILEQLFLHYKEERYVDPKIERGDPQTLENLAASLRKWINSQGKKEEIQEDGTVKETMGNAALEMLHKIKSGNKSSIQTLSEEGSTSEKYQFDQFDLITWLIISTH
jgi:superfamily II DNA/RNA helicase